MYKRLTEKVGVLDSNILNCSVCPKKQQCKGAENRRDICLEVAIDRLAELEDNLESGKLVRLPCAIEDKVYRVTKTYLSPFNSKKYEWVIEESYILRCEMNSVDIMFYDNWDNLIEPNDWGRGVFLTKAEAEKRLKELRGEV